MTCRPGAVPAGRSADGGRPIQREYRRSRSGHPRARSITPIGALNQTATAADARDRGFAVTTRFPIILVLLLALGIPAAQPAAAFGTDVHAYIMHAAFDHVMQSQTVDALIGANADADWHQFTPEYHFDSAADPAAICDRINAGLAAQLSLSVGSLRPQGDKYQFAANRPVAIASFGVVTHAIEDFYSHSNWVELAYSADPSIDLPDTAPLLNELFGCNPSDFPALLQTGYFNLIYGTDGCPSGGLPPDDFGGQFCHEAVAKDHPDSGHGAEQVPGHGYTYHQVAVLLATKATRQALDVLHDLFVEQYAEWTNLDVECAFQKFAVPDVPGSERACQLTGSTTTITLNPVAVAPMAIPTPKVVPTAAPAPVYYAYLLGADGGIGVVVATEQDAQTRPSCQWAGGGLDCSHPAAVFQRLGGPYASLAAADADLKAKLSCGTGYWGAYALINSKAYWLQNNVGLEQCKTIKSA